MTFSVDAKFIGYIAIVGYTCTLLGRQSLSYHDSVAIFTFSNQINLRVFDGKKYHDCHRRKGGLQNRPYYSVDSVTATDMRDLNKVKKILSFDFIYYMDRETKFLLSFSGSRKL